MNEDKKYEFKEVTADDIRNGGIALNAVDGEESKLYMIQDEFRTGMDIVKDLPPSVTFYGSARLKEDHPEYVRAYKLAYRIAKELRLLPEVVLVLWKQPTKEPRKEVSNPLALQLDYLTNNIQILL